jgi:hypothetical protein
MKIHRPKTIEEAVNDLHTFLDCDLWYAIHAEFKSEKHMQKYLDDHFGILKSQIKYIKKKNASTQTKRK